MFSDYDEEDAHYCPNCGREQSGYGGSHAPGCAVLSKWAANREKEAAWNQKNKGRYACGCRVTDEGIVDPCFSRVCKLPPF